MPSPFFSRVANLTREQYTPGSRGNGQGRGFFTQVGFKPVS
jgi:hypothetical protein